MQSLYYQFVVDRLSHPDFDQFQLISVMLKPVLQGWDPATTTPGSIDKLASSILKRAADDKAVWHTGQVSWEEQGNNVAHLWFALSKHLMHV